MTARSRECWGAWHPVMKRGIAWGGAPFEFLPSVLRHPPFERNPRTSRWAPSLTSACSGISVGLRQAATHNPQAVTGNS